MNQKDFVVIFGSVAAVVILWIGFTMYDTSVTSSLDPSLISDVQPISGTFDEDTLTKAVNRQIVDAQLASATIPSPAPVSSTSARTQRVILPTPTPSGVKNATNSAVVIP